MPIATAEQYRAMLQAAYERHYGFPAINVTSTTTANAALKGLADSKSDGIIQCSTGGGGFASGLAVNQQFYLVFHGGSGSEKSKIKESLGYGVVKFNIDTDCQYAFTRAVADHTFRNYDQVMKVDSEVGDKKKYDPRSYLKAAEAAMAARIGAACGDLESSGKSLLQPR